MFPRRLVLLASLLVLSVAGCSGSTVDSRAPSEPPAIVIDGAQIWDGTGASPVSDGVLVIKGERIEAVGPRGSVTVPEGATIVDAKGKTLIPGMINAHGHVGMTKGLVQSQDNYSKDSVLDQLRQYARYGVTGVLSLGLDSGPMFEIRGPATSGETPRAAVFTAGKGFALKGGYPAVHIKSLAGVPIEVERVDEIKAHMQELANQKVDIVKIWVDDHFGHYPKMPPEIYKAIIEEAHNQNLRVIAHIFYLADAKGLVEAGIDGLAHSIRDRAVDDALIKMMKEKGTFYVSTLIRDESTFFYVKSPAFLDDPFFTRWADAEVIKTLKSPAYAESLKKDPDFAKLEPAYKMGKQNMKKLFEAGVKLAFGTDSGPPARFQGYFEHLELEQMVDAGLTPAQALQIATLGTAQSLKIDKDFGSLEKGKRADFMLLDADPLVSIVNTRKLSKVWIGGREVN